jgi:hypothetical protein
VAGKVRKKNVVEKVWKKNRSRKSVVEKPQQKKCGSEFAVAKPWQWICRTKTVATEHYKKKKKAWFSYV